MNPKLIEQFRELQDMLATTNDPEFLAMVEAEMQQVRDQIVAENPDNTKPLILEVRSGTGGEEAELFGADLFRMYMRYIERKGWKTEVIELNESELGGIKLAVVEVKGYGAYPLLKWEGGVHRVQRIPKTEKSGRIHTSAASVVVMPVAAANEIDIRPEDIRIDVYRAGGRGGQGVNTTDSAVRITHLKTGIIVTCQDERSQLKNRDKAMTVLRSRLKQMEEEKQASETGILRRSMIGSGDRSDKIRTYNFPQDRVTDHRINKSWYGLTKILGGELDDITQSLQTIELDELLTHDNSPVA